jgi:hypothetical protein
MLNQLSLKYGLILGGISIALSAFTYAIDMPFWLMSVIGILAFIAIIILWVAYAIKVRKANGDAFTFGQAFTSLAIIGAVSMVLGQVWNYILTHVIDKEYMNKMIEKTVDSMVSMGMSPDDPKIEEVVKGMEEGMQFSKQMQNAGIGIIVMLVLAAIIAAIIKRSKVSAALDSNV